MGAHGRSCSPAFSCLVNIEAKYLIVCKATECFLNSLKLQAPRRVLAITPITPIVQTKKQDIHNLVPAQADNTCPGLEPESLDPMLWASKCPSCWVTSLKNELRSVIENTQRCRWSFVACSLPRKRKSCPWMGRKLLWLKCQPDLLVYSKPSFLLQRHTDHLPHRNPYLFLKMGIQPYCWLLLCRQKPKSIWFFLQKQICNLLLLLISRPASVCRIGWSVHVFVHSIPLHKC